MSVTVYTKPGCVQCMATYRALDKAGIDYEVIDLTEDENALNHSKDLGYFSAPIVLTATDHWSGFRPDKIAALAKSGTAADASGTQVA